MPNLTNPLIENVVGAPTDYGALLQSYDVKYTRTGNCHLQVGEINQVQGWILHLSCVIAQINQMLVKVIPCLVNEGVPFKIIRDEDMAEDILNGYLGFPQLGKIVAIYPKNESIALNLAKRLIALTKAFKGPFIPTDICLGSIIYTRYGSHNPVIKMNEDGNYEKYIYDQTGQLITDSYSIPFQLPEGISWPYSELAAPKIPGPGELNNRVYKLLEVLKQDPKGNVYKGLYVKSLIQVKHCVIKQGFRNMNSDMADRDMHDRLLWQYKLHKELHGLIPIPVVYAFFSEPTFTLLLMEYIKGCSLYQKLIELNPLSKVWFDMPLEETQLILKYIVEIVDIIDKMHRLNYVHRDINPVNFLITKNNSITLIDIELAYSLKNNFPNPPFKLGTPGFISPEQQELRLPTIFEDVYSMGATLLYIFTGMLPIKFNNQDSTALHKSVYFFSANKDISDLIVNCLSTNPNSRPTMQLLLNAISKYKAEGTEKSLIASHRKKSEYLDEHKLLNTIEAAVKGLTGPPIVIIKGLWCNKQVGVENTGTQLSKHFSAAPGLNNGIGGVIYALARIYSAAIPIEPCQNILQNSFKFLKDKYLNHPSKLPAGLFNGTAGLALVIAESIHCGLLADNAITTNQLHDLLDRPNNRLDLGNGLAGHAVSLLRCISLSPDAASKSQLDNILETILAAQKKDGLWSGSLPKQSEGQNRILNIAQDDTGILWLLLDYISFFKNKAFEVSITTGIRKIFDTPGYGKQFYTRVASKEGFEIGDGGKGLIRLMIKAYEVLGDESYKQIAEQTLHRFPPRITLSNYSQENGLAALGELYLEAWKVFKNEEWLFRSYWIANLFLNTINISENGMGHWMMDQNSPPTASLISGNGGIIHFLGRCYRPDRIGYRILT